MRRLFPLLLLFGCPSPLADDCRLNSDCPSPLLCAAGRCVPECREARDCTLASEMCVDGRCVEMEPQDRLCMRQGDCLFSETCQGGVCVPTGLVGGDDAGVMPPADAGPPADGGAPTGLPYGALCMRAADCTSMLCLGPTGGGVGRCTETCTADADCFFPDTCVDIPGAGQLCAQGTAGLPAGAPCPGGPTECQSGLCLTLPNMGPICTQECSPLPACPPGLICAPLPDGNGGTLPVCAPFGPGKGFGEACSAAAECASTLCVGVPGSGAGVCTVLCDQLPCPGGYACTQVNDGQGGVLPVCAAAGAVGGAFGDPCASAAECTSGLCLNDARMGSAFCTKSCSTAAECTPLTCVLLASGQAVCAAP